MAYEILVSHFLKDRRAVVTNNCREDIPLRVVFRTVSWAAFLYKDGEFCCSHKSPEQTIQLVLASSNVFRREIDHIPKGFSATVTFDGSGIEVVQSLLEVRPAGAFVTLRAGHS